MKRHLLIVGSIVLAIAAVSFWNLEQRRGGDSLSPDTTPSLPDGNRQRGTAIPSETPEGMKRFRSEPFRFTLTIEDSLIVSEYKEKGDAYTYVFEEKESGRSFQIYITPYGKDHIDTERFFRDQPSGVREDEQTTMIGGVPAIVFGGKNDIMGATREVWFIKDGLLYEVTTYRELDPWLAEIMNSWRFID